MNANAIKSNLNTSIITNLKPLPLMFVKSWAASSISFSCSNNLRIPKVRQSLCHCGSSLVIETSTSTSLVEGQQVSERQEKATASNSVARRLSLLRHAQSSWDNPSLRDHDRPLSKTGQADAAKVSRKLQQLGWIPQLILSSDAMQTSETLKIIQEEVPEFLDAQVHFISSFYSIAAMDGQTAEQLQLAMCKYSTNDILTVMHLFLQDLAGGGFRAL